MPESAAYDALAEAKRLLRAVRPASLATLGSDGAPLCSLAAIATMPDGAPILLLSQLAAHTRHLEQDPRCSLLLSEGGKGDPLAHPRLSLVGDANRLDGNARDTARRRFLSRNPKSALYADFPDFAFWSMTVQSAHLNGGFARAAAFEGSTLLTPLRDADSLLEGEAGAIEHMNADHREAIGLYATVLAGLPAGDWRLSGIDPDGLDLLWGDRIGRVVFPSPVSTSSELRQRLVAMAAEARNKS